jgi:DNA-3-methyladenine glycosylase I
LAAEPSLRPGADGRPRCWWAAASSEYVGYHDDEWGRPVLDDQGLYERLCLEAFQSGLSWLTILRKREAFRAAFDGFEIDRVAAFDEGDLKRLLSNEGIVRNRAKIQAAIENGQAALRLRESGESLSALIWSFSPKRHATPRSPSDLPASTPESSALAGELKRRGFRFVGPTTAYALMQACGLVNDHLAGCAVRDQVEKERRRLTRPAGH